MKIHEFIVIVDDVLEDLASKGNKEAFLKNMEHANVADRKFSEWMIMYLSWSELGSEEDCAEYYWNLEDQ